MAGLNVLTYLTAYLDACGRNGGKPLGRPPTEPVPALENQSPGPARVGAAASAQLTPPAITTAASLPPAGADAACQHACPKDFRMLTSGRGLVAVVEGGMGLTTVRLFGCLGLVGRWGGWLGWQEQPG